jgi:lysozyme
LTAYWDALGKVWTIAYGHTRGVKEGDTCTKAQAVAWLDEDLTESDQCVNANVTFVLTQEEHDGLVDFVLNLGCTKFRGSTLHLLLNAGSIELAALEFPKWDHSGSTVVAGLLRRRLAEEKLFRTGMTEV